MLLEVECRFELSRLLILGKSYLIVLIVDRPDFLHLTCIAQYKLCLTDPHKQELEYDEEGRAGTLLWTHFDSAGFLASQTDLWKSVVVSSSETYLYESWDRSFGQKRRQGTPIA